MQVVLGREQERDICRLLESSVSHAILEDLGIFKLSECISPWTKQLEDLASEIGQAKLAPADRWEALRLAI
jgi:hypothetical protein